MSFSPESTDYESTRERLSVTKAEGIAKRMEEMLEFGTERLKKSQSQ